MEYTYERHIKLKTVESIEKLSFEAAKHLAQSNSIITGDKCIIYAENENNLLEISVFINGLLTNKYICDKEED